MVLKLEHVSEASGHLLKHRVFDSAGLVWGSRICISTKSPAVSDAVDRGTILGKPLGRYGESYKTM